MSWKTTLTLLRKTAHLMVGVTDYDEYVAHCHQHHPEAPIMSKAQWFRDLQARRYGDKGIKRCC